MEHSITSGLHSSLFDSSIVLVLVVVLVLDIIGSE
jgi:hypothetical protein